MLSPHLDPEEEAELRKEQDEAEDRQAPYNAAAWSAVYERLRAASPWYESVTPFSVVMHRQHVTACFIQERKALVRQAKRPIYIAVNAMRYSTWQEHVEEDNLRALVE